MTVIRAMMQMDYRTSVSRVDSDMTKRAGEVREAMNTMGGNGTPFLVIIDYAMENPVILPLDQCANEGVFFQFPGATNRLRPSGARPPVHLGKMPVPFERYSEAFNLVMRHIRDGNSYLVNLTFPTPITLNLTLEEVFSYSDAPFRLLVRDRFVVFSPERFVHVEAGTISTFPMKGTIDAALDDAENLLLSNPKEQAEHVTVVDLLRNDLSLVARNVRVERYRYVEKVVTHEKTLLQISSRIAGDLETDYLKRLGDILFRLLPAGSICGAPKHKTLGIIAEAEQRPRGFYTGICGLFDGKSFDSCVLIRFIEQRGASLVFRSGGGITHASLVEAEYRELVDKVYVPIV
jgi:para-aminobenzoate synthetase component 1